MVGDPSLAFLGEAHDRRERVLLQQEEERDEHDPRPNDEAGLQRKRSAEATPTLRREQCQRKEGHRRVSQ